VLPKTESRRDVEIVAWLLGGWERRQAMATGSLELIALVETSRGVERASEIAGADPRLRGMALGSLDYLLDLGAGPSATEVLDHARTRLLVAARASGTEALVDSVYPGIHDHGGLSEEARRARLMGFTGKLVIHPGQVDVVNRAFAPSAEEIAWARRVVAAFEVAEAESLRAVQVDGQMVDRPVVMHARRLLALRNHRAERHVEKLLVRYT
jgi:citrate lyase subunit beta/citryl-CoA lyase